MNETKAIKAVEQAIRRAVPQLPLIMGNEAVNYVLDNFRAQGYIDGGVHNWPGRKNDVRAKGRALLVRSGRLRRSIRITALTADSATIGSDVPYAKAHNEGFRGTVQVRAHNRRIISRRRVGTGKYTKKGKERTQIQESVKKTVLVRAHPMKMNTPQRRFIGPAKELYQRVGNAVTNHLQTAIKNA